MWKPLTLLFIPATLGLGKANEAVDLLLIEQADQLLQIDNVQKLEKSLLQAKAFLIERENELQALKVEREKEVQFLKTERDREVTALNAELLYTVSQATHQMVEMKSRHEEQLKEQRSLLQAEVNKSQTLVSFMVNATRDNSVNFRQDSEGHIVAADFCQCIPRPPEQDHFKSATLSLVKNEDKWSATWSAWNYENCGRGIKSRRKLKALDLEVWEEEFEEVACTLPPQCFKYKELDSLTRKSFYNSTATVHCDYPGRSHSRDWKGTGWYRIAGGAGSKLADTIIPEDHCGTSATGWMTGGLPSVQEGEVIRTVNFNWEGNPARWTTSIRVVNCETHYVYYLPDAPDCKLAYCTV